MTKRAAVLCASILLLGAVAFAQVLGAWTSYQVTLGASATQVSTTPAECVMVVVQNNATHNVHFGDSTVSASKGLLIVPGASLTLYRQTRGTYNLNKYYLFGTAADVIDVGCQAGD